MIFTYSLEILALREDIESIKAKKEDEMRVDPTVCIKN